MVTRHVVEWHTSLDAMRWTSPRRVGGASWAPCAAHFGHQRPRKRCTSANTHCAQDRPPPHHGARQLAMKLGDHQAFERTARGARTRSACQFFRPLVRDARDEPPRAKRASRASSLIRGLRANLDGGASHEEHLLWVTAPPFPSLLLAVPVSAQKHWTRGILNDLSMSSSCQGHAHIM